MNVFGVVVLAALLQAQEAPPVRHPWDGFVPGSTAVTAIRNSTGAIGSTTTEVLESRSDAGLPRIREMTKRESGSVNDSTTNGDPFSAKPFADGLLEVSRRKETISIKSRQLDCEVVAYIEAPEEGRGRKKLTVWHAKELSLPPRRLRAAGTWFDVPGTVVRVDSWQEFNGNSTISTLEVLDLNQKVVVNGAALYCVVQEARSLDSRPMRLGIVRNRKEWLSTAVPGALVRREYECSTTEQSGHTTTELVDFKAVR